MAMAMELWETLKEAITAYTGLSPTAFFTTVALALACYHVVCGLFVSPVQQHPRTRSLQSEMMEPIPEPIQLGEITEDELKQYDGTDDKKPLLMAIKGQIYDVSPGRMFYGPGGPYALFAGKDASRALAKMSFEEQDLTGDISGLGPFELDALQDWEYKFMSKYVKVGTIKNTNAPAADGSSSGEQTQATEVTNGEAVNLPEEAVKLPENASSERQTEEAVETLPAGDVGKKDE